MRDRIDDIHSAGAQLLVIDPHEAWSAKHFLKDIGLEAGDVGYPLLLDPANTVSATYGVAMQMRIHTEISNRPATFIVDRSGTLRYEHRASSFSDRPDVDAILEELQRIASP